MVRVAKFEDKEHRIVDDSLSADDVRMSLAVLYPELSNATAHEDEEAGTITFEVKAGTKGMARIAKFEDKEHRIVDDSLSADDIRMSLAVLYPELSNATAYEDEETGTVTFEVKAGTKGMARIAKFEDKEHRIVDDSLSADDIRMSLAVLYPELSNATAYEDEETGTVTFEVKAGTKGY